MTKPKPPFVSPCGKTRHTVKDAAEGHGRSQSDIRRAMTAGELAAIKVGRTWTIRCEDVEAWIESEGIPNNAELGRAS